MDKVASIAASGIEHAHARHDIAAQDLIEDIDIDLPELLLNVHSVHGPQLSGYGLDYAGADSGETGDSGTNLVGGGV
jgi:hypothetical protein